jgi:beta-N-acetylhexosaminidase
VAAFAAAYVRGMHRAGMAATIKHFPGHGSVLEDTHFDAAIDPRPFDEIRALDLYPFQAGIAQGAEAVMMAHVTYPEVALEPAGYAPYWINDILRGQMGFRGVVFSDDIGMAAAESAGGVAARIAAHLYAGCDIVLVCPPALVAEAIRVTEPMALKSRDTLAGLRARANPEWSSLTASADYAAAAAALA